MGGVEILFRATHPETAESNATEFARAIENTNELDAQVSSKSSAAYSIHFSDNEFDTVKWLSDFDIFDKAEVYILLWDSSRPDVIVTTDYQLPSFPTHNHESEYTDGTILGKLTRALDSDTERDRKKAVKAVEEHSKRDPDQLVPLVPNIITALGRPTLSMEAKTILKNIAKETPEPIRAHLDELDELREDDNNLVSSNTKFIIEAISADSSKNEETDQSRSLNQEQSESDTREKRTTALYKRSSEFREKVRQAYNYKCTICESERRTPSGNPEIEAAHIVPVKDGGPDRVRNGLALCKLHHWAFDNGWISIDQDLNICVKNKPEVAGYNDFNKYDGTSPHLPDVKHKRPKERYLKIHREKKGF